ncbi:unnamed protein product [Periconia digitata]|uniref:Ribonucleases P/MRP subunit Pop8-like domain-containing protein n=1 Tax=Periconia digitata TaxID=1303443 RepID=A0A9W4UCY0_9PLEO|nr:unnamed protein product [Periconia digitata]
MAASTTTMDVRINSTSQNNTTTTSTITPSLPMAMDVDEPSSSTTASTKRKPKSKKPPHILHMSTHRNPPHRYFTLRLITSPPPPPSSSSSSSPSSQAKEKQHLDPLTLHPLLTNPLQSYLGLTGSSIPFDILSIDGLDVTVRVPREDARAFRAGVSSWVGGVERGLIPGFDEEGDGDGVGGKRVSVSWRVLREVGGAAGLVGDGGELFA